MQERICMRCVVSGKVQGVWYRLHTQNQAKDLGLTGWVRNLPDGNVEALVCGEREKIERMVDWMKVGPEKAVVEGVVCEEVVWQEYERFGVR